MKEFKFGKVFVFAFSVILLSACTNSKTVVEPENEEINTGSAVLEIDPAEVCNLLSDSQKILINSPCADEKVSLDKLNIRGKIIQLDEDVSFNVMQNGEIVFSKDIFPIPSNAAGDFKLLQETVFIDKDLKGEAIIQIEKGEDYISIPVKFE